MERNSHEPEHEQLQGDALLIELGIDFARAESRQIDHGTARRIASQLHGGQDSALYELASSGAIDDDRLMAELADLYLADDRPAFLRNWLDMLAAYADGREDKRTVDGWYLTTEDSHGLDDDYACRGCGEHFSDPHDPRCMAVIGVPDEESSVVERQTELDQLIDKWLEIGRANPWIRMADDPPFTRESFKRCQSVEELKDELTRVAWSLGTALHYQDLCLINQVDGGDEWLTIRHEVAFESITFAPIIEDGEFENLITRLLSATKEQCLKLEY